MGQVETAPLTEAVYKLRTATMILIDHSTTSVIDRSFLSTISVYLIRL